MFQKEVDESQHKREKWQGGVEYRHGVANFLITYGILIVAVFLFILFSAIQPQFITLTNIFTIVRQASILGLLALGLTIIVIVGEFDMSFVAVATFCGVIPVILIMHGVNLLLAWTIGIAFGIVLSLINAVNVTSVGVPSFIATLGMMLAINGVSIGLTGGVSTYPKAFPMGFDLIGKHLIADLIPTPVIIFVVASILLTLLVDYTPQGRYIYSVGGNLQAALHVGISVKRVKILTFLVSGMLYGVAGIVMSSMFGSCSPGMGEGYLLPSIIACFLGAAFLKEGIPNPRGTIVSSILLAILSNGFTMTNVPFYGRAIVQGVVLLISIGMLVIMRRKKQIV